MYNVGYWLGVLPGAIVGLLIGAACFIVDVVLGTLAKAYLELRQLLKTYFVLKKDFLGDGVKRFRIVRHNGHTSAQIMVYWIEAIIDDQ